MRCDNCGAELPDGARFCYMCAAPVEGNDSEKGEPEAAEPFADDVAGATEADEGPETETGEQGEDPDTDAAAENVDAPIAEDDGESERDEDEGGSDGEEPSEPPAAEYLTNMPAPVKLEGALTVGAVPFVPMAPAPRATYVPRHNARPVRSGRPGMSSTAGIPNGTPIHARQHEQGWSLEGARPSDPKSMIDRRNESDNPIGSLRSKMNKAFSSIGGSSSARDEKRRAEQAAEESRARARADLAARRAVIHAEQHEARAALAENEGGKAEPQAATAEVVADAVLADEASSPAAAAEGQGASMEPEATRLIENAQADGADEPLAGEADEGAASEEVAAAAASAEDAGLLMGIPVAVEVNEEVLEAEGEDPGVEPLVDPDDISGLWADVPGRAAEGEAPAFPVPVSDSPAEVSDPVAVEAAQESSSAAEATGVLGGEPQGSGVRDVRAAMPSGRDPRRASSGSIVPRAVIGGVALLVVAVMAFGAVTQMGGSAKDTAQQQEEQQSSSEQQVESVDAEQQQESPSEEAAAEPDVRATVEEYSWDELSRISALIAAAPSDAEGLAVAMRYNLCTASGTLDGTQVKTMQLSDGSLVGMRIVGLRQDARADGTGVAGITLMADTSVGAQAMNDGDIADWSATSLRAWLNGEFAALVPEEVSSRIVEVAKTTTLASDMSAQETTSERIWLLSYSEVVGDIDSNSSRYGIYLPEGAQYKMFADFGCVWSENSEHYAVGGGLSRWWTRSPDPLSNNNVIAPDNETGAPGYARNHSISGEVGVVPAFCI